MLYKYKDMFSQRDEIGTCPNIEVEIDVRDKSPFLIRQFHVKGEDKALIDKEMKRLCYLAILKEGASAYFSPVMLISRKLTKDKRIVTNFRHLNVRIAKHNLAYLLLKDMFLVLGSSKCEVQSVLDFSKMHCTPSDYQITQRNTAEYFLILVVHPTHIRECLWD